MAAANGSQAEQAFVPVLSALATLQANIDRSQKAQAHEYLENFQKSVRDNSSFSFQRTAS